MEKAQPFGDRSKTFWHGVNAIVDIQKSSEIDTENYSVSAAPKQKLTVEEIETNFIKSRLISPFGRRKILWDCLQCAAVLFTICEAPFSLGFLGGYNDSFYDTTLDNILVIIFGIDIIISFNCSYMDMKTGLLVIERKKIYSRYLRCWFWIDLISTLPFKQIGNVIMHYNTNQNQLSILRLTRIFRLSRLALVYKLFDRDRIMNKNADAHSFNMSPQLRNITILFLQVFLSGHIVCCFWFFITTNLATGFYNHSDYSQSTLVRTWATEFGYQNLDVFDQYIGSLYWTFVTLFTIGYGDIHATNVSEDIFSILIMLAGSILFGAIIAKIKDLVDSRNIQKKEIKGKMEEFKEYMEEKNYPAYLKFQAKEAYEYYLEKRPNLSEKGLFNILPKDLKIKIANLKYRKEIISIHAFHYLDIAFVTDLMIHSKPYKVLTGEIVYGINDLPNELSFILSGSVKIKVKGWKNEMTSGFSTTGGYFGDFEFTKSGPRIADYVAVQNCLLLSVPYKVLTNVIKEYPIAGKIFLDELKYRSALFSEQESKSLILNTRPPCKGSNKRHSRRSLINSVTVWVDGGLKDLLSQEAEIKAIRGNEINYKSQILKEIITIDNEKKNIVTDMNMNDIWKKGIFTPKNKFKTYWDVFMSLLVVYTVITLPCQLAFDSYSTINNEILTLIDYIIISFFFVDIIINMNTAYYSETYNAYVLTRKLIIIKYLRSWFFIDFVAFFPFELVIMNLLSLSNDSIESSTKLHTLQLIKSIRILRIIKSVKYMKISKYINNMLDKTNISPVMSNIMYTLFNVAVVGHFLACIWWGISSRLTDTPWYDEKNYTYLNLRDSPFRIQYITSLYLSIATLTTTGYGDITPQNTSERILAILIFIVGALVYGYVTANVSTIIRNFTKNETRANKFSSQIREYLNCEEISGNVLREVTEHARKIHRRSSTFDEDLLLGRLPHHLKLELILFQHREIIEKLPFFRFIKNNSIKLEIIRVMKSNYGENGRSILREGEDSTEIIFLLKGNANILRKSVNSRLNNIVKKKIYKSSFSPNKLLSEKKIPPWSQLNKLGEVHVPVRSASLDTGSNRIFNSRFLEAIQSHQSCLKCKENEKSFHDDMNDLNCRPNHDNNNDNNNNKNSNNIYHNINDNISNGRGNNKLQRYKGKEKEKESDSDDDNEEEENEKSKIIKCENDDTIFITNDDSWQLSPNISKKNDYKDLKMIRNKDTEKNEMKDINKKENNLKGVCMSRQYDCINDEEKENQSKKSVKKREIEGDMIKKEQEDNKEKGEKDGKERKGVGGDLYWDFTPQVSPSEIFEINKSNEVGDEKSKICNDNDNNDNNGSNNNNNESNKNNMKNKNDNDNSDDNVNNGCNQIIENNDLKGNEKTEFVKKQPESLRELEGWKGKIFSNFSISNEDENENENEGVELYNQNSNDGIDNNNNNNDNKIKNHNNSINNDKDRNSDSSFLLNNEISKDLKMKSKNSSIHCPHSDVEERSRGREKEKAKEHSSRKEKVGFIEDLEKRKLDEKREQEEKKDEEEEVEEEYIKKFKIKHKEILEELKEKKNSNLHKSLSASLKIPVVRNIIQMKDSLIKVGSRVRAEVRRKSALNSNIIHQNENELLGTLSEGDIIGYKELLNNNKYDYSVVATDNVWYYTLERTAVLTLIDNHPRIALELQRALAFSINDSNQKIKKINKHKNKLNFFNELKETFKKVKSNPKIMSKKTNTTFKSVVTNVIKRSLAKKKSNDNIIDIDPSSLVITSEKCYNNNNNDKNSSNDGNIIDNEIIVCDKKKRRSIISILTSSSFESNKAIANKNDNDNNTSNNNKNSNNNSNNDNNSNNNNDNNNSDEKTFSQKMAKLDKIYDLYAKSDGSSSSTNMKVGDTDSTSPSLQKDLNKILLMNKKESKNCSKNKNYDDIDKNNTHDESNNDSVYDYNDSKSNNNYYDNNYDNDNYSYDDNNNNKNKNKNSLLSLEIPKVEKNSSYSQFILEKLSPTFHMKSNKKKKIQNQNKYNNAGIAYNKNKNKNDNDNSNDDDNNNDNNNHNNINVRNITRKRSVDRLPLMNPKIPFNQGSEKGSVPNKINQSHEKDFTGVENDTFGHHSNYDNNNNNNNNKDTGDIFLRAHRSTSDLHRVPLLDFDKIPNLRRNSYMGNCSNSDKNYSNFSNNNYNYDNNDFINPENIPNPYHNNSSKNSNSDLISKFYNKNNKNNNSNIDNNDDNVNHYKSNSNPNISGNSSSHVNPLIFVSNSDNNVLKYMYNKSNPKRLI